MYVKTIQLEKPSTADYSRLLRLRNIKYKEVDDRYYQVGNIRGEQGWILHVSSTKALVQELYNRLIPELSKEKVAFKFLQNPGYVEKTVSGAYGYTWLGKVMRIYPDTIEKAIQLAKRLVEITAGVTGPIVPTDSWLGGTVYTRYGAFNPVVMVNPNGQSEHYIHQPSGQLTKDPNEAPFRLPAGIAWPFSEIASPQPALKTKTLHNRYMVRNELRAKPKGRVLKTYRVKGLSIKSAIIKESAHAMCDDQGRDLAERLHWQNKLHNILGSAIRLPRIFELFEERGNTYLAMELIKGKSLQDTISTIYADESWRTLAVPNKLKLIDYLLEVLTMVDRLHQQGYVHRDLTAENFMVDSKNRLVMIDLELAYDLNTAHPSPPYRLGTKGYMSPEQLNTETPTVREDIFALGALMTFFFTKMPPARFNVCQTDDFKSKLDFFLNHPPIIELTTACQHVDPLLRPSLNNVRDIIRNYREEIKVNTSAPAADVRVAGTTEWQTVIERTLQSLSTEIMANDGNLWHSTQMELVSNLGNKQTDYAYYLGYHTGLSGVLTTVAQAALAGISISNSLQTTYNRNLRHLQRSIVNASTPLQPGLYQGTAGTAIALASGMESGLVKGTQDLKALLLQWLSPENTELNLAHGVAGQGIAVLRALPLIGAVKARPLLERHIEMILNEQQSDGSWLTNGEKKTDLSEGIAGILLFLRKYLSQYPDSSATSAMDRGLNYLKKTARKANKKVFWSISNKNYDANIGLADGFTGIAVALLRCYELTQDKSLLELAESALKNYPPRSLSSDFTIATGIAGVGEVYMEAYRITKKTEWHDRSTWLASVLCHTNFQKNDSTSHWVINPNQHVTADLFTGNSGLIHFLLRLTSPESTGFFLLK